MQGFGPTTYTLPSLFWLIVKKPRVSSVQHDICLAAANSALKFSLYILVLHNSMIHLQMTSWHFWASWANIIAGIIITFAGAIGGLR